VRKLPSLLLLVVFAGLLLRDALAIPTRVTSLAYTPVNGTSMTLSWIVPTPGSGVLVSNDLRTSATAINTLNWVSRTKVNGIPTPGTPGTYQFFTVTGLTPSTTYYFALKVQDSTGWSTISNLVVATTYGATKSVALAWDAPTTYVDGNPLTALMGYKIYYGTASGLYDQTPIDVGNVTSFTVTGLSWDTVYYFVVTAQDAQYLESDYSNEVSW